MNLNLFTNLKPNKLQKHLVYHDLPETLIITGCRQSGKSLGIMLKALIEATKSPNKSILIITPNKNILRNNFKMLREAIDKCSIWMNVKTYKLEDPEIRFDNNSIIRGVTPEHNGMCIRGQAGHIVFIDNADYMTEEDFSVIAPLWSVKKEHEVKLIMVGEGDIQDNTISRLEASGCEVWNSDNLCKYDIIGREI
jgi:phage terminase large subunit